MSQHDYAAQHFSQTKFLLCITCEGIGGGLGVGVKVYKTISLSKTAAVVELGDET
jgi:hypothetical protein